MSKKYHISILKISFLFVICTLSYQCTSLKSSANSSESEWQNIFNGKDITNWTTKIHKYEVDDNYGDTFRVEDSILKVRYDKYDGDYKDRFGHLYYNKTFSYYHLTLEYRFVGELHPGAPIFTEMNSGIMFHSQDPNTMPKEQDWPISVEMQLLGGIDKNKERPTGNMCSPGTDIVYKGKTAKNHCVKSTSKTYYGDQWVRAELVVLGDSLITQYINGEKVLEYTKPQIGGGIVNRFLPSQMVNGKPLTEGFIALQSEGQPVDFKNIRIKNLKGCMNPKAKNYRNYYIKNEPEACVFK